MLHPKKHASCHSRCAWHSVQRWGIKFLRPQSCHCMAAPSPILWMWQGVFFQSLWLPYAQSQHSTEFQERTVGSRTGPGTIPNTMSRTPGCLKAVKTTSWFFALTLNSPGHGLRPGPSRAGTDILLAQAWTALRLIGRHYIKILITPYL